MFAFLTLIVTSVVDAKLSGPTEATVGELITIKADWTGENSQWLLPNDLKAITSGDSIVFLAPAEGELLLFFAVADRDANIAFAGHSLQINAPPAMDAAADIVVFAPRGSLPIKRWQQTVLPALLDKDWKVQFQQTPADNKPLFLVRFPSGYKETTTNLSLDKLKEIVAREKLMSTPKPEVSASDEALIVPAVTKKNTAPE